MVTASEWQVWEAMDEISAYSCPNPAQSTDFNFIMSQTCLKPFHDSNLPKDEYGTLGMEFGALWALNTNKETCPQAQALPSGGVSPHTAYH